MSFTSPEYRAFENPSVGVDGGFGFYRYKTSLFNQTDDGTVRITVVRTGGGYGTVGVKYYLRHVTTDEADVTAHAHYTTRCLSSWTTEDSAGSHFLVLRSWS